MNKIKLSKLLISFGVFIGATPIIATSCSSNTNSIVQINSVGLNNKVAKGGKIYATLNLSVNDEMQTIVNTAAFSSNENMPLTFTTN